MFLFIRLQYHANPTLVEMELPVTMTVWVLHVFVLRNGPELHVKQKVINIYILYCFVRTHHATVEITEDDDGWIKYFIEESMITINP